MVEPTAAPYGAWRSPLTADTTAAGVRLSELQLDGDTIYWTELRPAEAGRSVLVRCAEQGEPTDVTPAPLSARTRVHEYGGGVVRGGRRVVYLSNFADQRQYRLREGSSPEPLTPELPGGALRYADAVLDPKRNRLILVREDHREQGQEAKNTLVALALEGGNADGGQVLVAGTDFVAGPRLNPDGTRISWLSWNHPNMPWDGTCLWMAEITPDGALANAEQVAGGPDESIFQPTWSPDGELYFISDRTGWWNLYRLRHGQAEALAPMAAEFGRPQWRFGMTTYAFRDARTLICTWQQQGTIRLGSLDLVTLALTPIDTPYSVITELHCRRSHVVFIGASPTQPAQIVRLDTDNGELTVLRSSSTLDIREDWISAPVEIEFPTENGLTAHGFFYPPRNPHQVAPEDERPPLRVQGHGGPTFNVMASSTRTSCTGRVADSPFST